MDPIGTLGNHFPDLVMDERPVTRKVHSGDPRMKTPRVIEHVPVGQHAPSIAVVTPAQVEKVGAFIDIGTNSIRLLLVRFAPNHHYTVLSQQKEMVRLGEDEFIDNRLQPEAMRRAALVCRTFAEMARGYGADEIVAVATAATREAENQREFLRLLAHEAGIHVHIISGLEEARLIYLGVAGGVHLGDRKALFIDIGGGSTEIILGDQRQHDFLDSLKLGALRLTSRFFRPGETGPVSPDRFAAIQQYVRNATVRTAQRLRELPPPALAIGGSGTIENLADIAIRHVHKRARLRDDPLTLAALQAVVRLLCALPLAERRTFAGINPARADIIIAGAAILETLMEVLDIPELRISDRGLREGLIEDYLRRTHSDLPGDLTIRERSVLQLGRACQFEEVHAAAVTKLALQLYDSAAGVGLHRFGPAERELVGHAATLHDIGAFLSYTNHHAHTYYLIRNADLLGFDQTEIAVMALLARFHRKGFPSKAEHPDYAALDRRSRRVVRGLSPLLRLAESLDRSHAGVVEGVAFEPLDADRVALNICAARDCQLELWGVQANAALFERVYKRKLVVRTIG